MSVDVVVSDVAAITDAVVDVLPDLKFPVGISVTNLKTDSIPGVFFEEISLSWDEKSLSYGVMGFKVRSELRGLQTLDMREISVPKLLSLVIRVARFEPDLQEKIGRDSPDFYAKKVKGAEEDLLFWVARRAAVSRALQGKPNLEIVECFGASSRTATRWMAKAREKGLLD